MLPGNLAATFVGPVGKEFALKVARRSDLQMSWISWRRVYACIDVRVVCVLEALSGKFEGKL